MNEFEAMLYGKEQVGVAFAFDQAAQTSLYEFAHENGGYGALMGEMRRMSNKSMRAQDQLLRKAATVVGNSSPDAVVKEKSCFEQGFLLSAAMVFAHTPHVQGYIKENPTTYEQLYCVREEFDFNGKSTDESMGLIVSRGTNGLRRYDGAESYIEEISNNLADQQWLEQTPFIKIGLGYGLDFFLDIRGLAERKKSDEIMNGEEMNIGDFLGFWGGTPVREMEN